MYNYRSLPGILLLLLFTISSYGFSFTKNVKGEGDPFILVIDAGHGGKDPGAIGRISREKDINLSVAKAFGRLVETNCKDVEVVYTRKTDVFIPLDRRAEIANAAHADLFISIHTNALPKGKIGRGAETYTLGMARAEANLDVAKRENAVILVENNHEERYEGFNPNSSESYIIFEFMQDKYMKQSVDFAQYIQKEFRTTAGRPDKGVHQAGFLVLRQVSMPSVLIELGYISTRDEESFLQSKNGISKMSQSIYNAFLTYKERNRPSPPTASGRSYASVSTEDPEQGANIVNPSPPTFMVQLTTSTQKFAENDKRFKGLSPIDCYKENNNYKYTYGKTHSYEAAKKLRDQAKKTFSGAFIIAFHHGKKITVQEAINILDKSNQ